MVSKELLEKFKIIYQEEFKIVLSDEEAVKMATDLLNVMRIVTRPIPKEELENNYQTSYQKVPGVKTDENS